MTDPLSPPRVLRSRNRGATRPSPYIPRQSRSNENLGPPRTPSPTRRPASLQWLTSANPGFIDGPVRQFYTSTAEMNETRLQYGYPPLPLTPQANRQPSVDRVLTPTRVENTMPGNPNGPLPAPLETPFAFDLNHGFTTFSASFAQVGGHSPSASPTPTPAPASVAGRLASTATMLAASAPPAAPPAAPAVVASAAAVSAPAASVDAEVHAVSSGSQPLVPVVQIPPDARLVSVAVLYYKAPEPSARKLAKPAKVELTKKDNIQVNAMTTRRNFILDCLRVHGLHTQYEPSLTSGPRFKLWYKGGGSRRSATNVDTDREFGVQLVGLLAAKNSQVEINVEFDLTAMASFQRQVQILSGGGFDPQIELTQGTHVPQVSMFTPQDQINGAIIMKLKQRWLCQTHSSESGGPGWCYVMPGSGKHFGLNMLKLRGWASAIASYRNTIDDPPSLVIEGGSRDGEAIKARGRTGPYPATAEHTPSSTADFMALMASTMMPIAMLAMERMSAASAPSAHISAEVQEQARPRALRHPPELNVEVGTELRACLEDFRKVKGIDFMLFHDALATLDFTPDVLPVLSCARLSEILGGAAEGKVIKLQTFAAKWNDSLDELRR